MKMAALLETRISEDELLDAVEAVYRLGGYDWTTLHGAMRVEIPRDLIERKFQETAYLEGGTGRHICPDDDEDCVCLTHVR